MALDLTITHRLHTLSKLTDRVSQAAYEADAGIPFSEGRCLAAIGAFSPLSVNDLAQRANLNKGQASRAAQSLVDQGLVRKESSATDGRGVVLTLTTAGEYRFTRSVKSGKPCTAACASTESNATTTKVAASSSARVTERDVLIFDSAPPGAIE